MSISKVLIGFALSCILVITACSSTSTKSQQNRSPSASNDESVLDAQFESMMNATSPEEEFSRYFDSMLDVYAVAEHYKILFDQALAQATEARLRGESEEAVQRLLPINSPNYNKLLASRSVIERLRDKISYFYVRLLVLASYKISKDFKSTSDTQNLRQKRKFTAAKILSQFNKKLRALSNTPGQLYAQDLINEVRVIIAEFNLARKSTPRPTPTPKEGDQLQTALVESDGFKALHLEGRRLQNFLKTYERAIAQEAEVRFKNDSSEANKLINAEVELVVTPERRPQSIIFEPNPGKPGNIVGGNFPKGTWTITYDDGPSSNHTQTILKTFTGNNVKATFFWLAKNVKALPNVVKEVYKAGMPIANHSYTHANIPKLDEVGKYKEIVTSTNDINAELTKLGQDASLGEKQQLRFFRLPYGSGVNSIGIRNLIAKDANLIHVFWNVDSLDWKDKNPQTILKRVTDQMLAQGRGVILFHDIHSQTVDVTKMLIPQMVSGQHGVKRLLTLNEIVDEMNGN